MSGWMAWALALCAAQTLAAELPQQLAECGRLADAKLRLACYDGLAAGLPEVARPVPAPEPPLAAAPGGAERVMPDTVAVASRLAEAWDLMDARAAIPSASACIAPLLSAGVADGQQ